MSLLNSPCKFHLAMGKCEKPPGWPGNVPELGSEDIGFFSLIILIEGQLVVLYKDKGLIFASFIQNTSANIEFTFL
jgi:hypothetical protein